MSQVSPVGISPFSLPVRQAAAPAVQNIPAAQPAAADSVSFSAHIAQQPRFGHKLEKNHGVVLPLNVELDLDQGAQLQRALLLRAAEKRANNDDSNITLWLDSNGAFKWPAAADGFTDAIRMSDVPVDVVVKSYLTTPGLKPFLSASGKRLMADRARLVMSPPKGWYDGPVHEANSRVRLYNEKQRDLEWLVMSRTGATRSKVQEDFRTGAYLNALSALAYGNHGLADGVIVGEDEILTRQTLNDYYQAHNLAGRQKTEAREDFNSLYDSIDKVVAWARRQNRLQSVAQFSARAITATPTSLDPDTRHNIPPDMLKKAAKLFQDKLSSVRGLTGQVDREWNNLVPKALPVIHSFQPDGKKLDTNLNRLLKLKPKENMARVRVDSPKATDNTYQRDTVYFPVGFNVETGNQLEEALQRLFDKKQALRAEGKPISNILIVENSPGGMSIVTEQIKSVIEHGGIPVDVLIQGMGASGGSKLVSMATGNRFMTPNSTILLHQTRGGSSTDNLAEVTESAESMAYSSEGYMSIISQRSGRPLAEVRKDFKLDFWVNAVESIVYGPKGLVDAILVGPDKVLLREDVMEFLTSAKGSREAAEAYIEDKFEERRNGITSAPARKHRELEDDPLGNPVALVEALIGQGKARPMSSVERFKASASDVAGSGSVDFYNVLG